MKISLLIGAVVIIVLSVVYFSFSPKPQYETGHEPINDEWATPSTTPENKMDTGRIGRPGTPTEAPTGKIKADMFTGILEEVNTGCFSDGECSVTVDGKHVTVLMGWSQDTVGSIIGAPSIGDLEHFIGKKVEIYARDNSDGTYSLYGSAGFYVKVLDDSATSTAPTKLSPTAEAGSCVVGGCSSQLCVDPSEDTGVSTCIYNPQYACYKTAECKRQSTGKCGWTQTSELKSCLVANAGQQ